MPLEFIADVPNPVLLMYSASLVPWQNFHSAILDLVHGKTNSFGVHQLPGWEGVGGCHLEAKLSDWDSGLWRIGEVAFECRLSRIWWDNCEGIVAGFIDTGLGPGRVYLDTPFGDPNLEWCLSPDRDW